MFFDRKEEVIEFELTQYGKYVLGKGRFNPTYYEFFDDDIVYDSLYAGFGESQQAIQTRIKETPRAHTQYTFSSAETQMKKNIELVRSGQEKNVFSNRFIPTAEKHFCLSAPLGTSDISSDKAPSWNVNFIKGAISNTIRYTTGSHPTLVVPQISIKPITFNTFPSKIENINIDSSNAPLHQNNDDGVSDINVVATRFEDGSFIEIQDDFILIDIKEENVSISNENFDIEIFLVDKDLNTDRRNKEVLIPLYFEKKKQTVVNNLLIDSEDDLETNFDLDPNFVGHFFNVYVDREINSDTLCKTLSEDQIIALNQSGEFEFDCIKEFKNKPKSDVTPDDLEEDC